jgi:hypothetical protein
LDSADPAAGDRLKVVVETRAQSMTLLQARGWLRKDDDVEGVFGGPVAKRLTGDSFETVTVYGAPGGFPRNREPESGMIEVVGPRQDGEVLIRGSPCLRHDASELR